MTHWPQNAFRHSLAGYHLAKHCNAYELMLYMGHTSTKQISEACREFVRPQVDEAYWVLSQLASSSYLCPGRRDLEFVCYASLCGGLGHR